MRDKAKALLQSIFVSSGWKLILLFLRTHGGGIEGKLFKVTAFLTVFRNENKTVIFKLGQKGYRLLIENKQTSMWMIILHIKNELLLNINANNSLNTISSTDLESGVIAFSQVETEVRISSLMAA